MVSPARPVRSVNGLITGLHEPHASHLMMLEQVVAAARRTDSRDRRGRSDVAGGGEGADLERAYAEALHHQYLWHEFGDSHLIIA